MNAAGKKDDCPEKLRRFLDYVEGREVKADEFIEAIDKAVALNNKDKIWRKNMMTLEMEYMTREIMGEKRGEERGLRLGEERGIKLGEERGKKLAREDARYSDVSSGLYSPEKGAELLNMSLEDFLKGMEEAGYKLPEGAKV